MSSSSTTNVWLIRHAEPAAWARGRCYGRLDVPLSAAGIRSARGLADRIEDVSFDAICTSPSIRAIRTAAAIAEGRDLVPEIRENLVELDFGDVEGETFDAVARSRPELYERWMRDPASVRFPSGERFADLRARVVTEVDAARAAHPDGCVAVVTHAGPIRAILADVLGLDDATVFRIEVSYAAASVIGWVDDVPVVRQLNAFA